MLVSVTRKTIRAGSSVQVRGLSSLMDVVNFIFPHNFKVFMAVGEAEWTEGESLW